MYRRNIIWMKGAALLLGALLLSGCSQREDKEETAAEPPVTENAMLQFQYERDGLQSRKEAAIYEITWFTPEYETLKQELLSKTAIEEGKDAYGTRYTTKEEQGSYEVLICYDGGLSFEHPSYVFGGFSYGRLWEEEGRQQKYQSIVSMTSNHPDNIEQLYAYSRRTDFVEWADLGFLSAKEAANAMEETLKACGLPELTIKTLLSLDQETLKRHWALLNEDSGSEAEEEEWIRDAYLLQYEQTVDGIPLMDHCWWESPNEGRASGVRALITGDGIISLNVSYLVETGREKGRYPLLSVQEAEDILTDYYNKAVQIAPVSVESLQLSYFIGDSQEGMELVPAWVFCISKEPQPEESAVSAVKTIQYEHYVINAITGERILSMPVKF